MRTTPERITKLEPNEIFQDISGYEGLYCITSHGRVWSYPKRHGAAVWSGFWLRQQLERTGYLFVALQNGGKRRTHYVHVLVAKAFCAGYSDGLQVNHKDGIKRHNQPVNLEWVTPAENIRHSFANGMSSQVGSRNACAKLDESAVKLIRKRVEEGDTQSDMALSYKISRATVCNIVNRKTWTHV